MWVGLFTSKLNNMTGLLVVFGGGGVVVVVGIVVVVVVAKVDDIKDKNENGLGVVVVGIFNFGIGVGLDVFIVTENGLICFIMLPLAVVAKVVTFVAKTSLFPFKNKFTGFSSLATIVSECAVPESAIELEI